MADPSEKVKIPVKIELPGDDYKIATRWRGYVNMRFGDSWFGNSRNWPGGSQSDVGRHSAFGKIDISDDAGKILA